MTDTTGVTDRPDSVVRALWERFEVRDFEAAGDLLAEDVIIDWPVTRERITGRSNVVGVNRAYPEPWGHIRVLDIIADGEHVAARVRVDAPASTDYALGFYQVRDGTIRRGTEYWVTEGAEPPHDRSIWATRTPPAA
jgi:ketosteroid isomerase-like protein